MQPVGDRGGSATLDLPEQALTTDQVHEPDMPPVHQDLPTLALVIPCPVRTTPTDLVDTQHLDRLGLFRQHVGGPCGERGRHDRPGQAVIPRGLHDRASAIGDRATGRPSQPLGQPGPRRNLLHGFGEGLSVTSEPVTQPSALAPAQIDPPAGDGEITWPGGDPLLHPSGPHLTSRTGASLLVRGDQVHHRALVWCVVDPYDGQAGQAQQSGRIVVQRPCPKPSGEPTTTLAGKHRPRNRVSGPDSDEPVDVRTSAC